MAEGTARTAPCSPEPALRRSCMENTTTWGRELARYLLEQGQAVLDVAPIRTDRKRRRQPHPDKSDERDALAIAKTLMQDLAELPLSSSDDLLWTVSLVLGHREGLVRERTRLKNRLHALLPMLIRITGTPQYPTGFQPVQNGKVKHTIKDKDTMQLLRNTKSGSWWKVYEDGWHNGSKVSIHYFLHESGAVFNVKVKSGWSDF